MCLHSWTAGAALEQTKCVYGGYRRFLPTDSPARAETFRHRGLLYEYGHVERRDPPRQRTNEFVRAAATFAVQRQEPFLGHRCLPLTSRWPGFDYLRYNPGELMHGTLAYIFWSIFKLIIILDLSDSKIFVEMLMKIMIGKGPQGTSYANWGNDPKHRKQAKLLNIYEPLWPENGGSLPWRLSKADKDELNLRMRNVVWPHYFERLYYKGKKNMSPLQTLPTHYNAVAH